MKSVAELNYSSPLAGSTHTQHPNKVILLNQQHRHIIYPDNQLKQQSLMASVRTSEKVPNGSATIFMASTISSQTKATISFGNNRTIECSIFLTWYVTNLSSGYSAEFGNVLYPLTYTTCYLGYSAEFVNVLYSLEYATVFGNK